ncbi:MAG: YciI family protein, partial [Planctomycetaceae bacterium]|nr:YciI family protein [Planctomycetaceae bacterium]
MLLISSSEAAWTPEEWTACVVKSSGICHQLATRGEFIAAAPLHPAATATTVRIQQGRPLITTGPFAETTEQLGGFYLID